MYAHGTMFVKDILRKRVINKQFPIYSANNSSMNMCSACFVLSSERKYDILVVSLVFLLLKLSQCKNKLFSMPFHIFAVSMEILEHSTCLPSFWQNRYVSVVLSNYFKTFVCNSASTLIYESYEKDRIRSSFFSLSMILTYKFYIVFVRALVI